MDEEKNPLGLGGILIFMVMVFLGISSFLQIAGSINYFLKNFFPAGVKISWLVPGCLTILITGFIYILINSSQRRLIGLVVISTHLILVCLMHLDLLPAKNDFFLSTVVYLWHKDQLRAIGLLAHFAKRIVDLLVMYVYFFTPLKNKLKKTDLKKNILVCFSLLISFEILHVVYVLLYHSLDMNTALTSIINSTFGRVTDVIYGTKTHLNNRLLFPMNFWENYLSPIMIVLVTIDFLLLKRSSKK